MQERLDAEWRGKIESNSGRNRERDAIFLTDKISTFAQDIYTTTLEMIETDRVELEDLIVAFESLGREPPSFPEKINQVQEDQRKIDFNLQVLNKLSSLKLHKIHHLYLRSSIDSNDLALFYILLQFVDPVDEFNSVLYDIVSAGNIDFLNILLNDGRVDPTLNILPLLISIRDGKLEIVQRLLQVPSVREMALRESLNVKAAISSGKRLEALRPDPIKRVGLRNVEIFLLDFFREAREARGPAGGRRSKKRKAKRSKTHRKY